MSNTFTIAALFFGNFPQLAERLLTSIMANLLQIDKAKNGPSKHLVDIRLGLNQISGRTYTAVRHFTEVARSLGYTVYWYVPLLEAGKPAYKYPLMRRMLYGIAPVTADYFVWFDDDSIMWQHDDWLAGLNCVAQDKTLVALRYRSLVSFTQRKWIMDQVWAPSAEPPEYIYFPQGSWWLARTKFMLKWDYPFPELRHCGGDLMLGQLMRAKCQREDVLWLPILNEFVRHNCDSTYNPSSSPRRGHTEDALGKGYVGKPLPTDHQNIDYEIIRHQQGRVCYARDFGNGCHPEDPAAFRDTARRAAYQAAQCNRQQHVPEDAAAD